MSCDTVIFGGTGLLGTNWILNNHSEKNFVVSSHKRNLVLDNVCIFKEKKLTEKRINLILDEVNPKKIINLIGMTSIEDCEKNQENAFFTNVDIPKFIARAALERSIKFIHFSTDHLFDGKKELYTEECVTSPLNFYGKTKALAEENILKENSSSLIIRSNFYCWGPRHRKSFSDFIYENLLANISIKLFKDIFYTPIKAKELIRIALMLENTDARGIYNIASSERITKYDFGLQLAEIFNLKKNLLIASSINSRKDLVLRPKSMCLSNSKLKSKLNISINSLKESLIDLKLELGSKYYLYLKKL
jgi:dTDP-4-dehydrorhamnose reductase